MNLEPALFARRFEVSLAEPQASDNDLIRFLQWCLLNQDFIAAVAVNHTQLDLASTFLRDSSIRLAADIAFPLGGLPVELKIFQAKEATRLGAQQLNIVMPLEYLRANDFENAQDEVRAVVEAARRSGSTCINLIPNIHFLNIEQSQASVQIAHDLSVGLRTNTGYDHAVCSADLEGLRAIGGANLMITACGGVTTAEQAIDLIHAGANFIAVSELLSILADFQALLRFISQVRTEE